MRSDKQKITSQKKQGAKTRQKDPEHRGQPKSAAKQGHAKTTTAGGQVRRHDEKTGHTLH